MKMRYTLVMRPMISKQTLVTTSMNQKTNEFILDY